MLTIWLVERSAGHDQQISDAGNRRYWRQVCRGKGRYSSPWEPHVRATGRYLPYGITQCYLPHKWTCPAKPQPCRLVLDLPTPEGWKAVLTRPGVEPATFRSRVRRRTTAAPPWHQELGQIPGSNTKTDQQISDAGDHRCWRQVCRKLKADIVLAGNPISELWDVTCHMGSHRVTCPPTQVNVPHQTPAMQAGTRFAYPREMEGRVDVDLLDLTAPQPEVEPATFQ